MTITTRRFLTIAVLAAALAGGYAAGVSSADQPNMQAALDNLDAARTDLDRATHNKGGHRAEALRLVNLAIAEVKAGIEAGDR